MTTLRGRILRLYDESIRRRPTFAYLESLRQSQWWPPSRLAEHRATWAGALLRHARAHSPYWGERIPADLVGLDSDELLAAWPQLPTLARDDVQRHREAMATEPAAQRIRRSTGGSTGQPVQFYSDAESERRRLAASWRGYEWAGLGPDSRTLYLWGVPPRVERLRAWSGIRSELHHWLHGRYPFSLFELNPDTLPVVERIVRRHRVDGMVAFTGAADDLARLVEESGRHFPSLRSVVVGAEKLGVQQRERIQSALGTVVFETYGSREFMLMAAECPEQHRLHLTAEHHLVEILDDEGKPVPDGQPGRVAVTDLTNRTFPFIRYLNGDMGTLSPQRCPCGRVLPVLEEISGRVTDTIVTRSGQRISGLLFPHHLRDAHGIVRYQVICHPDDHLELRIVPGPGFHDEQLDPLRRALAALDNGRLGLTVSLVDRIAVSENGKYKLVVATSTASSASGTG